MKTKDIFVDLDGVLSMWVEAMCERHERPNPYIEEPHTRGNYNFHDHWKLDPKDFWSPINNDPKFWAGLNKTEEADIWMSDLKTLQTKHDLNVYILTSPSLCPSSHYGKAAWVKKHYPHLLTKLILTNDKRPLASPSSLLIDDSDSNITAWVKAGGKAILVPRPWNSAHEIETKQETLKHVRLQIQKHLR